MKIKSGINFIYSEKLSGLWARVQNKVSELLPAGSLHEIDDGVGRNTASNIEVSTQKTPSIEDSFLSLNKRENDIFRVQIAVLEVLAHAKNFKFGSITAAAIVSILAANHEPEYVIQPSDLKPRCFYTNVALSQKSSSFLSAESQQQKIMCHLSIEG